MGLSDEEIIALLKPVIPKEQIAEAKIYLDTELKESGEIVSIGRKAYPMPFAGYFIFIDLMPMANWGHPALGVFVNQEEKRVVTIESEFPPFFGDPPSTYRRLFL